MAVLAIWRICGGVSSTAAPAASASNPTQTPLTFSKDIAPIIYRRCAACHRPGEAAPFSLLRFADVKKRLPEILEVTQRGYMPPWPPEAGFGTFAEERRLLPDELLALQRWAAQGGMEGSAADLPPLPSGAEGWLLGRPDLILTLPEPYRLAPAGKDVYRNFVIPAGLTQKRFVRGIEFHPGNFKVVHHAFIKVDRTSQSRRMDAQDPEPGFDGMNTPAEMPDGHFLTWQPGKLPAMEAAGLAWALEPGNDLVLQMHLRPDGKGELVQPSVALYFTEQAPTNKCFKIALTSLVIDIPAGRTNYVIEDSFVLPIDAEALAVLPHAHYLAKQMQSWAVLPDGTQKWLLFIKDWDFNWQGDYRYEPRLSLPKGTRLCMRYTYDNSTRNPRNPHQPPQRVTYGPQSSDEMAELWLQLLPHNSNDLATLNVSYQTKMMSTFMAREEYLLQENPKDAKAHSQLGQLLLGQGQIGRALAHLNAASQLAPEDDAPHYFLGIAFRQQNRLKDAQSEFEAALRLNAKNYKAHGNLAFIALEKGEYASAESHFRAALEINPDDQLSRSSLEELLQLKANRSNALGKSPK